MATPVDVDNELNSQGNTDETSLNEKLILIKKSGQQGDGNFDPGKDTSNGLHSATADENISQITKKETEENTGLVGEGGSPDATTLSSPANPSSTPDQDLEHLKPEGTDTQQSLFQSSNIQDAPKAEKTQDVVTSPADISIDPSQTDANTTGQSTPQLDGTATPPTPRSTPAKPSVFKKTSGLQKIKLNETFLKNLSPSAGTPPISTTPRPTVNEKLVSSVAKALKPMVRNRLSNMGGTSMQRQGSGSSTSKSGRGTSPSLGRVGSGSDVWSWRRQPAAAREYSEEELQRQGVHLTARLSASAGDDSNKWADMDDDWSEEEVEETKEAPEPQDNHLEEPPMPIAPHLLESAALRRMPDHKEETVIVTKNERFADVTYDRRETRSPDDNIHGQRQIYNPKLRRFEEVPNQHSRDLDRSRRPVEIMQRGPGRRGSSAERRRPSFAKNDDQRQNRGLFGESRGYSPPSQRRPSFAERDQAAILGNRRRESFISTSGISDADRSISNASPALESQPTAEALSPVDIIALQQKEMAESRKRALERRAKDEEERHAAAERAKRKAEQLAAMASSAASGSTTAVSESPKPSPLSSKVAPASAKSSPVPAKAVPIPPPASKPDEIQPKGNFHRSDSISWAANRDQEEIIKKDSPSKEESGPRATWGAIGSPQPTSAAVHKHQQNGLFSNPNTLAAINSAIGGDSPRRGRTAPSRPARAPINPTNVPPSLQGWANFAANSEARKAHDDERQQERNLERERIEREKSANPQRTANLVDKWKRVEIKEPENGADIAGRTVVSVLKSGYIEDLSGNLEVRDLTGGPQKPRTEEAMASQGISSLPPAGSGASSMTGMRSPALGQTTPSLGMQSPTQSTLDKTPSRDRSRFFPSPSNMVDMSPRVVHPIQPSPSERSPFAPGLFPSVEDAKPAVSSSNQLSSASGTASFAASPQIQSTPLRQHVTPFPAHYGPSLPTSPGQNISMAPQTGGLTPRNTFSHTVPMTSPPPSQPRQFVKIPSAADFESVMERIRQTIQDSSGQDNHPPSPERLPTTPQHENIHQLSPRPAPQEPAQTQTGMDSGPFAADTRTYLKISAVTPQRDLVISTRDLEEESSPKYTVRVSLPRELHVSTRDIDIPVENSPRPLVKLAPEVVSHLDDPDVKSRFEAIDREDKRRLPSLSYHPRTPYAFKIQFMPSLQPKGGVVPNLVKKDKFGFPYINFEAKPEALSLPCYAPDQEVFYGIRERPFHKPKFHKKPFTLNRKPMKPGAEGSNISGPQGGRGPWRSVEKK